MTSLGEPRVSYCQGRWPVLAHHRRRAAHRSPSCHSFYGRAFVVDIEDVGPGKVLHVIGIQSGDILQRVRVGLHGEASAIRVDGDEIYITGFDRCQRGRGAPTRGFRVQVPRREGSLVLIVCYPFPLVAGW